MSIKFLVLGGGGGVFWVGGGKCRFYFYGPGDFCDNPRSSNRSLPKDNKFSDNKIRKISKLYCHRTSLEKKRFWIIFRKFLLPQPPPKCNCY